MKIDLWGYDIDDGLIINREGFALHCKPKEKDGVFIISDKDFKLHSVDRYAIKHINNNYFCVG